MFAGVHLHLSTYAAAAASVLIAMLHLLLPLLMLL